ncbi:MAG: hypothetical protein IPJ75_15905 [Ignavibacteriales bacterium]|nr:hypothetical protein [Ignavibacteriales bacterium]
MLCFEEDILNKDLLFVGTDRGLYLSLDGELARVKPSIIPEVSIRDLAITRRIGSGPRHSWRNWPSGYYRRYSNSQKSYTQGTSKRVTFIHTKPAFIKASGYRVKETGDQAFLCTK